MGRVHEWQLEEEEEERPAPEPGPPRPAAMSPPAVLALQRTAGNRAVGGMLMRGRLPPRGRRKTDKPFRKARAKSMYSGVKQYKSPRLKAKHGGGSTGPQVPVVTDAGERLWDGRRPGFRQQTYTDVLADKGSPKIENGREVYKCATCKQWFPRLAKAVGDEPTIDLDHVQDWDTYVTMNVDMTEFSGPDGHEWRAYLYSEITDAYNDEDNLVPKCSFHNRSKGGPQFIDRFQRPEHVAGCIACIAEEIESDDEEEEEDDGTDDGGSTGTAATAY